MAEGLSCKMTMFEIEDYCQVISRTWNPQLTEDGWSLLLEYPAADEQSGCVIRTTVAVLRVPKAAELGATKPRPGRRGQGRRCLCRPTGVLAPPAHAAKARGD